MSTLKVDNIRHNSATSDAITMASDGTCTAKVTSVGGGQLSHRNLVINGDMKISQRGTSFADSANGSYTLDRFLIQNSSGTPAFTVTQDSDAPHGFNNSLKVACTTADASPASGSFSRIRYTIEAQDLQPLAKGTSSAKTSTLSFYVKTNKTGVYTVFVYDDDNNRMFSANYTVSDTNWNRYTIIIPADTTGAINDDNGAGFVIHWGLSLGSNRTSGSLASNWATYSTANEHVGNVNFADNTSNVWAITGVQLEVGDTATSFEHRSFTEELTRCYRYYRRFGANGALPTPGAYNRFSIGYSPSSTGVRFPFQLDPPMRITPVNSNFSKSGSFAIQPGSIGSYSLTCDDNSCSPNMMVAIMGNTSVSSGTGSAVSLHANNDTSAYIDISAEL